MVTCLKFFIKFGASPICAAIISEITTGFLKPARQAADNLTRAILLSLVHSIQSFCGSAKNQGVFACKQKS
jgi:hypothetical protein